MELNKLKSYLVKATKKNIRSIEVCKKVKDTDGEWTYNMFGKDRIEWFDGESVRKTPPEEYKNILERQGYNPFWERGRVPVILQNQTFYYWHHIKIILENLKDIDMPKSIENSLRLYYSDASLDYDGHVKLAKELKEFIENDLEKMTTEDLNGTFYHNFKEL